MDWSTLLSTKRLGKNKPGSFTPDRSPFQVDYDRLIFSSAFRRLQDKTQVFPLAESDYVRTRLTHSLEVSSIGRSIGTRVGKTLCERHALRDIHPSDIGAIIAAACLAHDIGNPPFGHSGENAIRHWFSHSDIASTVKSDLSEKQRADVERYEGNAQGFRTITYLQMPENRGGMQLTSATLAAFTKYPRESIFPGNTKEASTKKFGFFQSEKHLFKEVADETGLLPRGEYWWHRHPLAFIVEAADDVTYRIIDYEDGYKLGLVPGKDICERFQAIINDSANANRLEAMKSDKSRVEYLRARAFETVIGQITQCFLDNEQALLDGTFNRDMVSQIPAGPMLEEIKDISIKTVYSDRRVVEIEAAGFEVASGLLDLFVMSANDVALNGKKASPRSGKILQLVPSQFREHEPDWNTNAYGRLMSMLDFFCGMTDSYAVSLFKMVKGISLPGA